MKYIRKKYPDGGIYASVQDFSPPHVITERINNYEDLFFIKSLKEVLDYNGVKDVEIVIPCLFQQQADRRFETNQSFELKLICEFIDSCNFKKVSVFHPHSDVSSIAIKNFFSIDNSEFIKKVLADIPGHPIMLSTDGGSYKWINKLANTIAFDEEVYGASKARKYDTEKNEHSMVQVIDRKDFLGADILVVDDLCVYGGTFLGLSKMLKERNAGKVYLAVSHITVPNPNPELDSAFERIYCTDSKYDSYNLNNLKIFPWRS